MIFSLILDRLACVCSVCKVWEVSGIGNNTGGAKDTCSPTPSLHVEEQKTEVPHTPSIPLCRYSVPYSFLPLSLYSLSSPVSSYRFCPLLRQLLHLSSRSGTSSCTEPSLFSSSSLSFLSIFPFTISTPRRSTLPPTPRHRQRPFFFFFSSSSTIQQPYHLDSITCNIPFIRFMPF